MLPEDTPLEAFGNAKAVDLISVKGLVLIPAVLEIVPGLVESGDSRLRAPYATCS
jgi:hypothetical protein